MAHTALPDQALLKMPSFKAMRSFVAAARYQNFTRAADALCVTQAAISRQIRDLELHLGTELFVRGSRELQLTVAGETLFDAVQVSFLNIFQATERIRREHSDKRRLTLCCSPAMSGIWLTPRLPGFLDAHPGIDLEVITTQHFLALEPGLKPDVFITKTLEARPGYRRIALFHEVVYPVCTPAYLAANPQAATLTGLQQCRLLELNPYGRAQLSEHVDWSVWFAVHALGTHNEAGGRLSSNDFNLLMQMTLDSQGVSLGWDHLVRHWLAEGRLVRPVPHTLPLTEAVQYLVVNEHSEQNPACQQLLSWLQGAFQ